MFDPLFFAQPLESAFHEFYNPSFDNPGLGSPHNLPHKIGIFNWHEVGSALPDWMPGVQDETVYMGGATPDASPEADHQRSFHFGPWSWSLGSSVVPVPQLSNPADYHSNDEYAIENYGAQPYDDGTDSFSYANYLGQQNARDRYVAQDSSGVAAAHGYSQTANVITDPIGAPPPVNPDASYESARQSVFPEQYSIPSSSTQTELPEAPTSAWRSDEAPYPSHGYLA